MGTKQYDSATDLITLTRASGGTALRKISYGTELVTNGTFDSDTTGWTPASFGLLSVDTQRLKLETNSTNAWTYTYHEVTVTIGQTYRFRASSTEGTATAHRILLGTHFANGNIVMSGGAAGTSGDKSVDTTFTATTNIVYVALQNADGVLGSYTFFDNISVKEVFFDQPDGTLQLFNYGNDAPRIEYNADGTVKGLLIEEARTNLYLNSSDTNTNSSYNITKTSDSAVSPDGTTTADLITPTAINDRFLFQYSFNFSSGSGNETYSFYAKSNGYNLIEVAQRNQSVVTITKFDLSAVTATTTSGTEIFNSIEDVGNGWYRCSASYITTKANPYPSVEFLDTDGSQGFTADGTSGIYFWGHQLEAGSFPTSYIPTSGATATRARELASILVTDFGYNKDAGSLVLDVETPLTDQLMIVLYFNTTAHYNSRGFVKENGSGSSGNMFTCSAYDGSGTTLQLPNVGVVSETTKLGLSYKDNEVAVRDGGTVVSGVGRYTNPTQLYIGGRSYGGGYQSQCWIKSIKYYPRKLTDAQLQELTT